MKPALQTIELTADPQLPRVLVISGLHGNETNAIVSCMKLKRMVETDIQSFDALQRITFYTGVNEYGIRNGERNTGSLYDGADLNRLFAPEGLNHKAELEKLIADADVVIDVHNSPMLANCVLLNFDDRALPYYRHFSARGIRSVTWVKNTPTVKNYVNTFPEKHGLTVELNGMGFESDVDTNVVFLHTVLSSCGSLPQIHSMASKPTEMLCVDVRGRFEGVLDWDARRMGQFYHKGDEIARVLDFDGGLIESITAPVTGWVMVGPTARFVGYDELIFQMSPELKKEGE